jgi:hypothetical protein
MRREIKKVIPVGTVCRTFLFHPPILASVHTFTPNVNNEDETPFVPEKAVIHSTK